MRLLQITLYLFVFFFINSCEKEQASDLLTDEEIIPILADIHIAEAAMQNLVGVTKDSMGKVYYQQIFELHGIDSTTYNKSMEILRKDPARLSKVYNEVVSYLEENERALN